MKNLLMIEEEACTLDLELNRSRIERICLNPTTRVIVLSAILGLHILNMTDATLLGSPIGDPRFVDKCISEEVNDLKLMGDRIKHLHFYDALMSVIASLVSYSQDDAHPQDHSLLHIYMSGRV